MRKLRVGVVDLVTKGPSESLYGRVMNANLASIMPQVIATWCEGDGHDVAFLCYTGIEDLASELPLDVNVVFIGAFTQAAQLAYALSNLYRSKGAITVLGGPHARCYPQDACRYFDYVLGFVDRDIVRTVLEDCVEHRPVGVRLGAQRQPLTLPGVRERWKFVEITLRKAPLIKIVPMLGSLGCPYTCSFCIDSVVPYQPLDQDVIKEDLRFLLHTVKRPRVAWHDPNFGIRFDDCMTTIEAAVPPGRIDFIAESSLSLLSEAHLERLRHNGFKAVLPGIESWYDMGNKSKSGSRQGIAKVRYVADHVNLILKYIPYIQTNFVLGLDGDEGAEPFELTKRFVDLAPGAFPGYSLLSAFGQAAPLNLAYQRAGRVLPFPFHFLNNNHAMNVRPAGYEWRDFYSRVIDLTRYTFSNRAIYRRYRATREPIPRWMNVLRAISSEGSGRIRYYRTIRARLDTDRPFRAFFEGETTKVPDFYVERVRNDLGPLWRWLPEGALHHDANAYLNDGGEALVQVAGRAAPS
ncbi:MAG TPA: hypothetical protein VLN49_24005 [Gemmatimonadaceae bacterium]|nr:hypothetical protein [Gemmatimonadaceae bacterium]